MNCHVYSPIRNSPLVHTAIVHVDRLELRTIDIKNDKKH